MSPESLYHGILLFLYCLQFKGDFHWFSSVLKLWELQMIWKLKIISLLQESTFIIKMSIKTVTPLSAIKRMDALSRNILCIKTTIGTVKKQGSGNCINLTFYPCCTSGVQSIMRLISSVRVLARNSTIVRVSQEDL